MENETAKKKRLALEIVNALRKQGFQAYFVGGCVRDMLMRRKPKDIDIATDAQSARIKKIFPRACLVGAQFGTLLIVKEGIPFQVSSFRGGGKDISADLRLRDFTINAMAFDPLAREIIDPAGGKKDIRAKRIAAVGEPEACFLADPLRLIRAVRFSANLGFNIAEETARAVKKFAGAITKVSRERVRDELISTFTGANPAKGLTLLDETGLLSYVLPDVVRMKGVRQPAQFHPEGDVFQHTLLMLQQLKHPPVVLAFACLLHDVGKPDTFQITDRIRFSGHDKTGARMTESILKGLKFPNKDREAITACVDNHMRMLEAPNMREATLKRLFARPTFSEEMKLHYIDCLASHNDLTVWRFLQKKYTEFQRSPVIPKPLLNGGELKKMGWTPGPIFGRIHRRMVDLQLEGKIKNKTQAKKWVREKFARREKSG